MFDLQQLNATFGAQVSDIDLAGDIDDAVIDKLFAALTEHKVLVFHDQPSVDGRALLSFSQRFGRPEFELHPTHVEHPDAPGVKILRSNGDGRARPRSAASDTISILDSWHTDGSTRDDPAWISFLRAVDIPPTGRDTLFADMEAVLRRFSPTFQAFLESLHALHSWGHQKPDAPPVEHPVVMRDASNERRWLYVNRAYTRKVVELGDNESGTLLAFLFEQAHLPECQLRVAWTPDTLVMWDNRTTQHYLVQDVSYPRVMHRVMVQAGRS